MDSSLQGPILTIICSTFGLSRRDSTDFRELVVGSSYEGLRSPRTEEGAEQRKSLEYRQKIGRNPRQATLLDWACPRIC